MADLRKTKFYVGRIRTLAKQNREYIALNNLYNRCERQGNVSKGEGLLLLHLLPAAYPPPYGADDFEWQMYQDLIDFWMGEFEKLEGWLNV